MYVNYIHTIHRADRHFDWNNSLVPAPKHIGRFDYTTGTAKGAPCIINLKSYPTKVEGGKVFINLA